MKVGPENNLAKLAATPKLSDQQMKQIKATAKHFEGMFMTEMFNHMFSGIETDPMFGGGQGEQIWRGMMVQEYGKMIGNSPSGVGLSDQIVKQMITMQQNAGRK